MNTWDRTRPFKTLFDAVGKYRSGGVAINGNCFDLSDSVRGTYRGIAPQDGSIRAERVPSSDFRRVLHSKPRRSNPRSSDKISRVSVRIVVRRIVVDARVMSVDARVTNDAGLNERDRACRHAHDLGNAYRRQDV